VDSGPTKRLPPETSPNHTAFYKPNSPRLTSATSRTAGSTPWAVTHPGHAAGRQAQFAGAGPRSGVIRGFEMYSTPNEESFGRGWSFGGAAAASGDEPARVGSGLVYGSLKSSRRGMSRADRFSRCQLWSAVKTRERKHRPQRKRGRAGLMVQTHTGPQKIALEDLKWKAVTKAERKGDNAKLDTCRASPASHHHASRSSATASRVRLRKRL